MRLFNTRFRFTFLTAGMANDWATCCGPCTAGLKHFLRMYWGSCFFPPYPAVGFRVAEVEGNGKLRLFDQASDGGRGMHFPTRTCQTHNHNPNPQSHLNLPVCVCFWISKCLIVSEDAEFLSRFEKLSQTTNAYTQMHRFTSLQTRREAPRWKQQCAG